jgi:hypothetical protein
MTFLIDISREVASMLTATPGRPNARSIGHLGSEWRRELAVSETRNPEIDDLVGDFGAALGDPVALQALLQAHHSAVRTTAPLYDVAHVGVFNT